MITFLYFTIKPFKECSKELICQTWIPGFWNYIHPLKVGMASEPY